MYYISGQVSDLMFTISLLRKRIKELESGEAMVAMQSHYKQALAAEIRRNHVLEKEKAHLYILLEKMQEKWFLTCDDLYQEILDVEKTHKAEIARMQEKIWEAERQRDAALEKAKERAQELYEVKVKLDEAEGKIKQLQARINKNHTNSSKPSSMDPNHPRIPNGREQTERKPGGQEGHEHHPRKRQEPTETHTIPVPEEFKDAFRYRPTGEYAVRQLVGVTITTFVKELRTPIFRDFFTGKIVHADFPAGFENDVNYDGSLKALAYLLNNDCNVSIDKTRCFLKDISEGKIDLSTGMICNLVKIFSEKTEEERNEIFLSLMAEPVLHADFTFHRIAGKQGAVIITASPNGKVMFQARKKKGNEGVKDSPVEAYAGTVVSDHEAAFVKRGSRHQECMSHARRYTIGSTENEPELEWNKRMKEWISKAVHYWKTVKDGGEYSVSVVDLLLAEYDTIIAKAQEEYDYVPPTKYYMEGYNLFVRMRDDKEDYVLFLRDPSVPPTNNLVERYARVVKRKDHQIITRRSQDYAEYYCDGLTMMYSIKSKGGSVFKEISKIFDR